jgi:DNA-binding beta-propeller fold protein YncE
MIKEISRHLAFAMCLVIFPVMMAPRVSAAELKVLSDQTAGGFGHVESVAYDPKGKVLYTSDFGPDLKPADKDGKGKITKVSLDGKILEDGFLPANGQTLNKPKGIWIQGNRLWVTDIDSVWVFDLKTKQGKKLDLPVTFANDPAVMGNALYVSDNRSDMLVRVEPADFLQTKADPRITVVFKDKSVNPNGLYPGKNGALLMVGQKGKEDPRGIYSMAPGKDPELLSDKIGMLDGLYLMSNGDVLATDWATGSLFQWNKTMGMKPLVTGFKGPADLCAFPNSKGLMVVVPDLVKGELRFVQLGK